MKYLTTMLALVAIGGNAAPLCPAAESQDPDRLFTEMYIPYSDYPGPFYPCRGGNADPYLAIDNDRQHLHIMQPGVLAEKYEVDGYESWYQDHLPVLLWSHGSGGRADSLGDVDLRIIAEQRVNVIAWESSTSLGNDDQTNEEGTTQCWADLENVVQWVKDNAEQYRIDATKIVVGGRSRGSICSWKYAQSGNSEVVGIFMYNALPGRIFTPESLAFWDPKLDVSTNPKTPRTRFQFGPECPKVATGIDPLCDSRKPPVVVDSEGEPLDEPVPGAPDIHNPYHGQIIKDEYKLKGEGFGDRLGMTDGLDYSDDGIFDAFPQFAQCLRQPGCLPFNDPLIV